MKFCDAIDQVRRCYRSSNAAFPAAAFDQVVHEKCDELVGINKLSTFVEYAEAVGVAIGGEAELDAVSFHQGFQLAELLVCRFGVVAAEVNVASGVKNICRNVLETQE